MRLCAFLLFSVLPLAATAQQAADPQVNPDHTVTFRYTDPAATKVTVEIDLPAKVELTKDAKGVWSGISPALTDFGSLTWFGLPRLVYLVIVLGALGWYVLVQTPYGRSLYAIGSNPRAARLVGIKVQREVFLAFVVSGTLAGVAGVLTTARTGGSTTDTGTTVLFGALAAVFLGLTAVTPGRFNIVGTMIGVLFVAASVSGLTLSGASDWVQPVFNGGALMVAVILSTYLNRRRRGVDAL